MTTEPHIYRKKPVEIQAMRWDGTNAAELEQWTGGNFRTDPRLGHPEAEIWDELHASWINVLRGQWVIRGVQGEFYPIAEDVFEQTYDEVSPAAPTSPSAAVPAPVQGADPTGPREASWDEPPADATARRQWEEDVLKKAVAPTGPQEAHSGDESTPCGEVIRVGDEMVDCSYDEGHSGDHLDATGKVAWSELGLRLPDPWTAVAEGAGVVVVPDLAFNLAAEMAFNHHRAGRRREGKALDAYAARLAELRASTEEARPVITAKYTTCRASHDGYTCTNERGHDGRHEDDENSVSWPRSVGEEAQS